MENLHYEDLKDKCYGVAGMTIALAIFDKEYYIESVSVDRTDIDSISFSADFALAENQTLSAKSVWRAMIEHYKLAMALMISNVMCRQMVLRRIEMSSDILRTIKSMAIEEGADVCQLEEDECMALFGNNYNQLYRVFTHPAIVSLSHDISHKLEDQREILRSELLEMLAILR